jgi:hypothetical protein
MTPGDFPQLMADVKQFQAVLEEIMAMASNPMEKDLLGAALQNIRKGVAEAETSVPQAFAAIETHARKAQEEGAVLQEEYDRKKVEVEALQREDEQREAARQAAQPALADLFGPVSLLSGIALRLEMLEALGLRPTEATPEQIARARGQHREIWEDWHWE